MDDGRQRDLHELHLLDRGSLRRILVRTVLRSLLIVGIALAAYYVLPLRRETELTLAAATILGIMAIGGLLVWQIGAVSRSTRPSLRAVEAIVTIAALITVVFASTYLGMSEQDATSFSEPLDHTGALYFTMTTLSTIGYGDIVPRTEGARIVVMLQMVVNVAVLGAAVRVLVGTARARVRGRNGARNEPLA